MTDIETRLRSDLSTLADSLLRHDQQLFRDDTDPERGLGRGVLLLVASVLVAVTAGFFLRQQVSRPVTAIQTTSQSERVIGVDSEMMQLMTSAMSPTIPAGSPVLMFELADDVVLQRGDLVVVRSRSNPDVELIRRIIGLPGENGGSFPPLRVDGEWIMQPNGSNGDLSPVTGMSDEEVRSSRINFGYVVKADNEAWEDDVNYNRFSHDEIRLWAPADTTAIPPLLESERGQQILGLETCLETAGLNTTDIRMNSREVFLDVSSAMNAQNIDEVTAEQIFQCVQEHSRLSR